MRTTKHCDIRMQQRGISNLEIELIGLFGKQSFIGGSVCEISISKKEKQKLIRRLRKIVENLEGNKEAMLIAEDETVITTYRPTKRSLRDRKQRKYPKRLWEMPMASLFSQATDQRTVAISRLEPAVNDLLLTKQLN